MNYTKLFSVILAVLVISACTNQGGGDATSTASSESNQVPEKGQSTVMDEESEANILNIAIGSADHTTLVAAVQAAQLEDVLVNAGPLTVFAPTNDAFAKLPEGTVENLLKPENLETLKEIIHYHAAPGSYDANNIKGVMGIGQANMQKVDVTTENGETFVNGNKVLATVKASNGWVHVIDGVLLPPEE